MNWIYKTNKDNSARFVLGTEGQKPLICIGVNPSTAAPDSLDNTLKSVERHATAKGFDSWIMLNLYPQRATNPKNIHNIPDVNLHKSNLKNIKAILKSYERATIWAAWGNLIDSRSFLSSCLFDIIELSKVHNTSWINIGKVSKVGHPHHPLYLSLNAEIVEFDLENYLQKLKK